MKSGNVVPNRILIMEDEPAIRKLCQVVLTREGLEVEVANNGKIAQEKVQEGDYDLVLIDVKTPVMDGQEFYQFLVEKHPELLDRVIFTTGDTVDQQIMSFAKSSGKPLLAKPFSLEELKAIVSKTLTGQTG